MIEALIDLLQKRLNILVATLLRFLTSVEAFIGTVTEAMLKSTSRALMFEVKPPLWTGILLRLDVLCRACDGCGRLMDW